MSILIQPKQVSKFLRANLSAAGYAYPAAASSVVTTALATAAATAGDGLVAVPVQVAATGVEGFVVAAGENLVNVFNAGVLSITNVGDTDGTTGVVTNVPATTSILVGMTLVAALNGIPAGTKVTAKTASSVTFAAVSTSAGATVAFTVQSGSNDLKIADYNNNEVYGRLTQAAGVYTLALFSLVVGVETSYVPALPITIDFVVSYQYSFEHLPSDSLVGGSVRHINNDPASLGSRLKYELMTVTALNTMNVLTTTYVVNGYAELTVNGQSIDRFGGALAAFSISGTTVTWSAVNAGFSLIVGDRVVCTYTY